LESIAIIDIDTLYVVDRYNDKTRLQVFPSDSLVGRTLWNGFDSIVLIDENGTFYTASYDGNIQRWIENAKEGEKINCQCNHCSRIWFDSEKGDFYIVERFYSRVIKCNSNTNTSITVAGIRDIDGSSNETLSYPYGLYVTDMKDIYITDVNNHRIQKWTQNATAGITIAGQTRKAHPSNTSLHRPYDVVVDKNGFIYIADMINHRILRWKEGESQGEVLCGISGKQ
jgi:sugar lactone lactonase YvrE